MCVIHECGRSSAQLINFLIYFMKLPSHHGINHSLTLRRSLYALQLPDETRCVCCFKFVLCLSQWSDCSGQTNPHTGFLLQSHLSQVQCWPTFPWFLTIVMNMIHSDEYVEKVEWAFHSCWHDSFLFNERESLNTKWFLICVINGWIGNNCRCHWLFLDHN